jgi:hypothetical protein
MINLLQNFIDNYNFIYLDNASLKLIKFLLKSPEIIKLFYK